MKKKKHQEPIRGSLVILRRRCGKTNCKCRDGRPHETWALSYSVNGRTHMLTLREMDVSYVRKGLALYKKESAALETRALRGIEKLRGEIQNEKSRGGK